VLRIKRLQELVDLVEGDEGVEINISMRTIKISKYLSFFRNENRDHVYM
jgi:hypothetical protein